MFDFDNVPADIFLGIDGFEQPLINVNFRPNVVTFESLCVELPFMDVAFESFVLALHQDHSAQSSLFFKGWITTGSSYIPRYG